uniref:Uncharacterized protein n=1 Tax=Rhizophora mucronata TaxID=61149 RepID=A0A2P2QGQ7_RHIMU
MSSKTNIHCSMQNSQIYHVFIPSH